MTKTVKILKEMYRWLPEKFWEAFDSGRGYQFDARAELYACDENRVYYYCSDCDSFHWWTMHREYFTQGGNIVLETYNDYECGDSESYNDYPLGSNAEDVEHYVTAKYEKLAAEEFVHMLEWMVEEDRDPAEHFRGLRPDETVAERAKRELPGAKRNRAYWTEVIEELEAKYGLDVHE